jgi:hypothetical protein
MYNCYKSEISREKVEFGDGIIGLLVIYAIYVYRVFCFFRKKLVVIQLILLSL